VGISKELLSVTEVQNRGDEEVGLSDVSTITVLP